MKICYKKLGTSLFLLMSLPLQAQQTTPPVGSFGVDAGPMYSQGNKAVLQDIKTELLYLGYYLGFPIDADSKTPPNAPTAPTQPSNFNNVLIMESESIKNLFGMLSSSIFSPSFVPSDNSDSGGNSGYALLNTLANSVIKNNGTTSTAFDAPVMIQNQSAVNSTNPISPVSQLVLNILSATPDELCVNSNNQWNTNCPFSYTTSLIYAQALGMGNPSDLYGIQSGSSSLINNLAKNTFMSTINDTTSNNSFFPTSSQNPQTLYLQQVDSSLFLSPLVYSQNSSKSSSNNAPFTGMDPNSSQVNAAQAFFRNVTGSVLPNSPPSTQSLQDIQSKLNSTDLSTQMSAFKSFGRYVLGNRIYAAQESVAIQNIYEIMSKRMPFNDDNPAIPPQSGGLPGNSTPTSEAMNEFIMATYRLYNPSSTKSTSTTTTWQNMISTTSSVNVQREIAILLSELNYQMYLMRQQQERLVLVNSINLINMLRAPGLYANDDDSNSNS